MSFSSVFNSTGGKLAAAFAVCAYGAVFVKYFIFSERPVPEAIVSQSTVPAKANVQPGPNAPSRM